MIRSNCWMISKNYWLLKTFNYQKKNIKHIFPLVKIWALQEKN